MHRVPSWSISRLQNAHCPRRVKLQYIDRVPEPDRGNPPNGMAEWPNDRGTRVHAEAEEVVRGERPITHELRHFEEEFRYVRAFWNQQKVLLEQRWAFNDAWEPVEYAP